MAVEIRPVRTGRELGVFIKLPWRLYRDESSWVAPLVMDLRKRLDQKKNPFFKHAEAQYFLAYGDRRAVGRVSAPVDRSFNEFQDNEWGLFGWFECEDDPEAACVLLDAAEGWLRERGRDRMVGPMDFTTNDEIGVLISGREHPPIIEAEHGIVCRNFSKKDLQGEVARFLEVYNSAWERNWGFVPLNEEEVRHYAKDLKPVLDENWAMVAEKKDIGEVVGAALTLPDFNRVLGS